MRSRSVRIAICGAALIASVALAGTASTAPIGPVIDWYVLGGGGGASASAHYVVRGTLGQAASGPPLAESTSFAVNAGYWFEGTLDRIVRIFLPLVTR